MNQHDSYYLKTEDGETDFVYGVARSINFDGNKEYGMTKGDDEIRFVVYRDPYNQRSRHDVVGICGEMHINGSKMIYLSAFSHFVQKKEGGVGKKVTFSYQRR